MQSKYFFIITFLVFCFSACQNADNQQVESTKSPVKVEAKTANPPAKGFDLKGSDPKAIEVADQVMEAMGGREVWDETKLIHWDFMGRRRLLWDKEYKRVRIDYPNGMSVVTSTESAKGWVARDSQMIQKIDSVVHYLKLARSHWINDSYWLVMPFKLKDSGVTLKHLGEEKSMRGFFCDVLELTFKLVGDTPQNKYKIYVNKDTKMIEQWAYYKDASDKEPAFDMPWGEYKKHGNILLAEYHGKLNITDIKVLNFIGEEFFKELGKINVSDQ